MATVTAPVTVPVEKAGLFLQWTPVFAGAAIGTALSFILLAFGAAIGLSTSSAAPTWRDASFRARARLRAIPAARRDYQFRSWRVCSRPAA